MSLPRARMTLLLQMVPVFPRVSQCNAADELALFRYVRILLFLIGALERFYCPVASSWETLLLLGIQDVNDSTCARTYS